MKKNLLLIGISVMLTACGGINYVGIETCNPGEVTFPKDVKKILMVNNAVPQPDNTGYTYWIEGKGSVPDTAKVDSALFDMCTACGRGILDASYFDDVLLFHDPLQEKSNALLDVKLTSDEVRDLCAANGTDAVISLDKMLFTMKKEVSNLGAGFLDGKIDIKMQGIIRAYLPEREQPLATVLIEDSVRFQQMAENLQLLNLYLPSANEALRIAGNYLGDKIAEYFVPHWNEETRWYYNSSNSRWKEAAAYASVGKWEEAEQIWEMLYNTSTKSMRAKLASNIALTHEIRNQLEEARDWAEKSYSLFRKYEGENSDNTKLLKAYLEVLTVRIQSDKKLNVQIGNKN